MSDPSFLMAAVALLLGALAVVLGGLVLKRLAALGGPDETLSLRLQALEDGLGRAGSAQREELRAAREEAGNSHRALREEIAANVRHLSDGLGAKFGEAGALQKTAFAEFAALMQAAGVQSAERMKETQGEFGRRLELVEKVNQQSGQALREGVEKRLEEQRLKLEEVARHLRQGAADSEIRQKQAHSDLETRLTLINETNAKAGEALKTAMETQLATLRQENEAKLEQMRATVDEKLQGTLEARLGESFKIVSERLEAVHKGLGEMQTLATGVGDLKRVLTNVKSRGGWGEVQLGALLEQMLAPGQYAANVATGGKGGERVEYAIRLPGHEEGAEVLLPLDAKFPIEDYERLQHASELGDLEGVERTAKALGEAVRLSAKTISEKYINPPTTTDFAILFLPTEGLYAEIIRRPGLCDELQRAYRVTVAGPTTLTAILSSLQMGFRTLAIQKRSGEVWQVLGGVKTEFGKFGPVLDKVKKKLQEATNHIEAVDTRKRAIERKLRGVEALEIGPPVAAELAALGLDDEDEDGPGDRFVDAAQ